MSQTGATRAAATVASPAMSSARLPLKAIQTIGTKKTMPRPESAPPWASRSMAITVM